MNRVNNLIGYGLWLMAVARATANEIQG